MTDFIPQTVPFTGRKMLFIIVMFFAVIIAVNGTMLTFAVKTFGGLVVSNSYVASQHFNRDVAIAKAQPIRGWSLTVTTDVDNIVLRVNDREGSPIQALDLTLTIARPTHDRSTITIPLEALEPGEYAGAVALRSGQWRGTLATADGQARSFSFTLARRAS